MNGSWLPVVVGELFLVLSVIYFWWSCFKAVLCVQHLLRIVIFLKYPSKRKSFRSVCTETIVSSLRSEYFAFVFTGTCVCRARNMLGFCLITTN